MVAIAPFCALRYQPSKVGDLSLVIAPPYDIINAEEQERLYHASPYNIVRLIYGKEFAGDHPANNRYTRASQEFEAWQRSQILLRDHRSAVYPYEHAFRWGGQTLRRLGFIALLLFDDDTERRVFRHEATLESPKADRTKLLEAVHANLSPIFCLYPDASGQAHQLLQTYCQDHEPTAVAHTSGETVRCWALTDPSAIEQLRQRLAPASIFIADGHHRFEVALAHRHLSGAVMSYFSWLGDPAVVMQPIHRMIRSGSASLKRLEAVCGVEPEERLEDLMDWLEQGNGHGRFGAYLGGRCYRVTLNGSTMADWLMHPTLPLPIAELDVSLLHHVVLPRLLGETHRDPQVVSYTADPAAAVKSVDRREWDLAWFLKRIPLDQAYAIAAQGLKLPPKSTYFYPKVLAGFVINPFDDAG